MFVREAPPAISAEIRVRTPVRSRAIVRCMDFQGTLFETPAPGLRSLGSTERHPLSRGAWVDVRRDFVSGADEVLERLIADVPWRAERRQMYDRGVDVPRLVPTHGEGEGPPPPPLAEARAPLSAPSRPERGEPFLTAGCCYYRDGRDSVAW